MSNKIPKQYRYYLSGSIVPDFQNYVWDRTEENSLSIIKGFYHGGGIRGINTKVNGIMINVMVKAH